MSNRYMAITCALVFTTVITGCPKKQTIVSEASKNTTADEAKIKKETEEKARKKAEAGTKEDAAAKARIEEEAKKERMETERARMENAARARAEAAKAFQARDVHFDFDRYDINTNDRESLKEVAEWLLTQKDARVVIEGHADERGSSEYNLALGDRRAHSVKDYLAAMGVSESRMTSVSFGEERPVCTESAEDCWWKNRRGHFVIK